LLRRGAWFKRENGGIWRRWLTSVLKMTWLCRAVAMLLLAATSVAEAAPNVPPSELPGRERERFTPSPLDRFMQPQPLPEPLIRSDCDDRGPSEAEQGVLKRSPVRLLLGGMECPLRRLSSMRPRST
jgi:hypothetical protein